MKIVLPFPSSSLAGNGAKFGAGQWGKIKATKQHREWARLATLEAAGGKGAGQAMSDVGVAATEAEKGDIPITIRFVPPNNRGDRVGYPYRMKAYFDGIADALKVNDKRFHPCFIFCEPEKPGRVEVYIGMSSVGMHKIWQCQPSGTNPADVDKKTARAVPRKPRSGHDRNAIEERSI